MSIRITHATSSTLNRQPPKIYHTRYEAARDLVTRGATPEAAAQAVTRAVYRNIDQYVWAKGNAYIVEVR